VGEDEAGTLLAKAAAVRNVDMASPALPAIPISRPDRYGHCRRGGPCGGETSSASPGSQELFQIQNLFEIDEDGQEGVDGGEEQDNGQDQEDRPESLGRKLVVVLGDIVGQDEIPECAAYSAGQGEGDRDQDGIVHQAVAGHQAGLDDPEEIQGGIGDVEDQDGQHRTRREGPVFLAGSVSLYSLDCW